jgi:hypothetical protein
LGFIWSPSGWLKSRNDGSELSFALYTVFGLQKWNIDVRNCKKDEGFDSNPCIYFTTEGPGNAVFSRKTELLMIVQQTLYIAIYTAVKKMPYSICHSSTLS